MLLLCFVLPVTAQTTFSGYIADAETKENLISATVYALPSEKGVLSNTYGFFSLEVPATTDTVKLIFSYVGYKPKVLRFTSPPTTQLQVLLQPDNVLDEVEVVATDEVDELPENLTQMSTLSVSTAEIEELPALLGEVDLIKVLQLMPGVQSGSEGSSGLYVRGGGPAQNLMLLDGVPVYNAAHLFGFFSIFNTDAIKKVELTKGGFPARYGGRLSSVLDISMKEGNMEKFEGEGSIGLISSKLTLQGPIKKDKASFIVSARRTYIDLLARPLIKSLRVVKKPSATIFTM